MEETTSSSMSLTSSVPGSASGQRESRERRNRDRKKKHKKSTASVHVENHAQALIFHPVFLALFGLLALSLSLSFYLYVVLSHPDLGRLVLHDQVRVEVPDTDGGGEQPHAQFEQTKQHKKEDLAAPHLFPKVPILPVFPSIDDAETHIQNLLAGKPSMVGIVAFLQKFLNFLHQDNLEKAKVKADIPVMVESYFKHAKEHLTPLEDTYRGKSIFPVREDGSIFVSLAAFREHLLAQTLKSAFDQAKHPDQLFIGAIVQNCFGIDGRQCRTGLQVIGKNEQGKDMVKMSDAPPDENGIETFCKDPNYQKYCDAGHVRVIYMHDTDALGPAIARYYASKLWGGEEYILQMDSHLEFAPQWDAKYIAEAKAAKSFPKAILSAYPPGFQKFGSYEGGSPGARLCRCEFSSNEVENHIIRINTNGRTSNQEYPTQIAFIAAGFFFARADFLKDVPFDPYVPWCFMGEEIALSIRAWTAGWDIYAPRQNLIAHQYRPGRLGLPKFWESVGRDSGRPQLNTRLQKHVIGSSIWWDIPPIPRN